MIITKTPFRISFVGGGSDIEEFYSRHEGAVLSATINQYMYLSSHDFFDTDKIRVKYSRTETETSVENIKHPIVREVLKKFHINGALEISSNSDIPAGTGLGSSSAFTVGLLANLYARAGVFASKERLAKEACEIEIDMLREPIGRQDQYACAYGGLNVIKFSPSGETSVFPIHLKKEIHKELQSSLLLFYTGDQRSASEILEEQKKNLLSAAKTDTLKELVKLVWQLRDALCAGELARLGETLHKGWLLKKQLASKITNPEIDRLYSLALDNGATGGKLLGAGGGGFLLFYCPQANQPKLRKALAGYREMKFKFENDGAKLIYAGDEYVQR